MEYAGICFKLPNVKSGQSMFLFPSLSSETSMSFYRIIMWHNYLLLNLESFKFSITKQAHQFLGVRVKAPQDMVFLPGLMCQLIVQILRNMNVSQ